MLSNIQQILTKPEIHVIDVIDIAVVAFILFQIYKLLRKTRAMRILSGLTFLIIFYFFARLFQLETIVWLFEAFSGYVLIVVIVILQPELRRVVYKFGDSAWYRRLMVTRAVPSEEIVMALYQMAEEKIGALIILVNKNSLREHVDGGIVINGRVSSELLISIFYDKNPLHDGAVIIEGGDISLAAGYLPLSTSSQLKRTHGARHRAGLGISEESDALVLIVSEEKGKVSVAFQGILKENIDAGKLRTLLLEFNNSHLVEGWASVFGEEKKTRPQKMTTENS